MDKLTSKQIEQLEQMRIKRTKNPFNLKFKVSEKGAISVYGVGRFPVTYYVNQWQKIIHIIPLLKDFISENEGLCEIIINDKDGEK